MTTTPTSWLDSFQVNTISTGSQFAQDIVGLSNGNFLVVFADTDDTIGTSAGADIVGVIYDAEGTIVTTAFQLNTFGTADDEETPTIAATNDGGFVMAYLDRDNSAPGQQILIERYNGAGTSTDTGFVQLEPLTAVVSNPQIAVNQADNSMFVSYQWSDGNDDGIRGKRFDADLNVATGTPADGFVVGDDDDPSLSQGTFGNNTAVLSNGNFVTVFSESDGSFAGSQNVEFRISNGTTGANDSNVQVSAAGGDDDVTPDVAALSGGGFVVVWLEEETTAVGNDNGANILFSRYNSTGTLQGSITTVADTSNEFADPAVIGLEDGGFFIAAYDTTNEAIQGTRYDASGNQVGGNMVQIESGITNVPDIELSLTTDGRILLTYQDSSGNIQAEILDPRDAGTITAESGDQQTTTRATEDTTLIGVQNDSDTLFGQGGDDLIYGGDLSGPGAADVLYGGEGNDTLNGGLLHDNSFGGAGNDTFVISANNEGDDVFGGSGIDTLDFSNATLDGDVIFTSSNSGTYIGAAYTFSGISVIIGNSFDRTWDLSLGTESVVAGSGQDLFTHGTGEAVDDLDAGGGIDTFDASGEDGSGSGAVGMSINNATGQISGQGGTRTFENFEIIDATQLDDTITGDGDDETLSGNGGNDTLDGGAGDDVIFGGAGADTLDGGAGNDTLQGDGGSNTYIVADDGSTNTINGSITLDTIDVSGFSSGIVVGQNSGVNPTGNYDIVSGNGTVIENANRESKTLVATDFDDEINELNLDVVYAGAGNDEVIVYQVPSVDEAYFGGAGTDTLNLADGINGSNENEYGEINLTTGTLTGTGGAFGFENVIGTESDNTITGTGGANSVEGRGGEDIIYGREGTGTESGDQLYGGDDDDEIYANGGFVDAGSDNDYVRTSNTSTEEYYGGTGIDTLDTSLFNGNYTVDLQAGTTNLGEIFAQFENYIGGNGNHTLTGTAGSNTLTTGTGDDTLEGLGGADDLNGGAGIDTASYASSGAGVTVNLGTDSASGGHAAGDDLDDIENLIGSGFNDSLTGDGGANTLSGNAGDDTFIGGAGADRMYGGADDDTADYSASGAGIDVRLNGSSSSGGDAQGDRLYEIENIVGSDFDDTITGNGVGNTLDGGGGADSIIGSGDEDLLIGRNGSDEMRGNAGNDEIRGGDGNDRLFGDEDEDMIFGGADNDRIFGGSDNDTVEGGDGDDELFGTLGADLIYGGNDDDLIAGNDGADVLYGDNGADTINGNESADVLYGGANDDALNGGSGLDELFGGGGEDVLNGGASSDQLTGGGGSDTFQFTITGDIDQITDWQDGIDVLDFTADGLGFSDFTVSTIDGGVGTKIVGGGYIVFFEGVPTTDIDATDFL
ncbi:MAG: calcium-binding protein [Pseudomonadota bacterium]